MDILAISGSARNDSTNTALLKGMAKLAPAGVDVTVYSEVQTLPVFSPDNEGTKTPAVVLRFMDAIKRSDGLIISSPEYVHAIPGGLKNAIDWLVSGEAVIGKPIALVHASHRGDEMLDSLRRVLGTISDRFTEQHFLRFPLISKTPEEVEMFLRGKEQAQGVAVYLSGFAEFAAENAG